MTRRILLFVIAALLPAGCIAPPQPFAPTTADGLASLPGVAAVRLDLDGFASSTRLEYAMSAALGARDLPVYFGTEAPAGSHNLTVRPAEDGRKARAVLADAGGATLETFETDLDPALNPQAMALAADQLARRVADRIIPQDPTLAPIPEARIAVMPGLGAPGDGNEALIDALARSLGGRVPLDAAPSTENYVVTVRVAVKSQPKVDSVALVWLILDPKGREAARLTQTNQVPAGALVGGWGKIAQQAADAAAEALIPVLRILPAVPPQ